MFHIFENKDKKYLYLTSYKQFFEIDENTYLILKSSKDNDEVNRILSIYEQHVNEEDSFVKNDVKELRYGLFLCISNTCNASCSYCFANKGNYGKDEGIMSVDIARKAIDFFMNKVPINGQANIIFFGGEPLMAYNQLVSTCEYIKERYIDSKNIQFHLVTNGTLLNEKIIDYIAMNNFSVGISIDGNEKVQNEQRPLKNGKNSFLEATKHLDYLLKKVKSVHARGTYSNFNNSLVEAYEALLNLGFKEVNIAPDILNEDMDKKFNFLIEELDNLYDYIINYINNNDDFPFGIFIEHIRRIFLPRTNIKYTCGLGEVIYSVDIYGDIYPCHRFSSESDYKLGNVMSQGEIKEFSFTTQECNKCWNQYTCSHGCCYNDYILTDSLNKKNLYWCAYSKKMTELCLALIPELSEKHLKRILAVS
ncbi:hypothetical protein Y919_11465 [Caloranaerobacter azorensis H53214]|uniref:Radical SAM core domain-containing protein n=1 Tax=Caloranaerobacter azorensis H53214 TaxID=1156417 RepID=A0A096BFD4_9FIRM|nr:radical SAM protein [Caloranaerobacter azorensis]KGG79532.1 hypothetical protein Y919_11465 [Caloranaerobacter azorensis H53214]